MPEKRAESKNTAGLLFLLICILLSSGCGIESPKILFPPICTNAENAYFVSAFEFENESKNNADFLFGYEIVYKFYSPDDEILENDQLLKTSGEEYLTETVLNNLFNLSNLDNLDGYRRLNSSLDTGGNFQRPLIPVNPEFRKDASLSFTADFQNIENQKITYMNHDDIYVGRYVSNDDGTMLTGFKPGDFSISDDDITFDFSGMGGDKARLVLYAVSYGKYQAFQNLYSTAVYLGQIEIKLN